MPGIFNTHRYRLQAGQSRGYILCTKQHFWNLALSCWVSGTRGHLDMKIHLNRSLYRNGTFTYVAPPCQATDNITDAGFCTFHQWQSGWSFSSLANDIWFLLICRHVHLVLGQENVRTILHKIVQHLAANRRGWGTQPGKFASTIQGHI